MPPIVLTVLKLLFIALLYLFIARAIRIIYLDLVGTRVPKPQGARPAPKARRRGTPRTVSVNEPGKPVRTMGLGEELTFGRSESCDVQLEDTYCSSLHARLFSKNGSWFIEDLGSTNGTYLNRVKVTAPQPVSAGDEVRVGKTIVELKR